MRVPVAGPVSLLTLIAKHGSVNSPVSDYAAMQKTYLSGLEEFLPDKIIPAATTRHSSLIVQNLHAAGALIKNSLRNAGGHLTAPGKKLFYVRIPKAANTSCSFALLKINFPDLPQAISSTQVNLLTDCWLERTVSPVLKTQTGFTLVRHPLHRLVSVYRDFFERKDADFIYNGYLFGVLPKSISFDEFVLRISKIPNRLKDQHFRPQSCFLETYRKEDIPVKVFKLEHRDELEGFFSSYGIEMPNLNQSPAPYDYHSYYSSRSLSIAQKMYASDFLLFNYEQFTR